MTFLDEMDDARELHTVQGWNAHELTGDRKGTWSLTVAGEIIDLDYEDYH